LRSIEGPRGFAPVLAAKYDLSRITDGLGTDFQIRYNAYKPYPCCQLLHAFIEAAKQMLVEFKADGVTVNSNGGLAANPNSPLARALGVPVQLEIIDDFDRQITNYISGRSGII